MSQIKILVTSLILLFALSVQAMDKQLEQAKGTDETQNRKLDRLKEIEAARDAKKRPKDLNRSYYTYLDRPHSTKESAQLIGWIYLASWAVYPITQPGVFKDSGSFKEYKRNFGQLVFDRDEPFWNWFVHPISGSQLYLFYRANGYTRTDSLGMTLISSTLFEFTVEVYTEPASVQDLYQTPIMGSLLGYGLETLSMYLLNNGNAFSKFFGHLINPSTLFGFYEGKIQLLPTWNGKDTGGVSLIMDF